MHPSVDVRRSDAMQIDAQLLIQPAMYTQGDGNAIKYVSTVKSQRALDACSSVIYMY